MNKTPHSISVSASIHADKRSHSGFAPLFIKSAILLCGCLGSVFTFLTCIDLGVSFLLTASVIISSSLIFTLIFSLKTKYFTIASSISMLFFIAAVFFYRNDICAGIANMLNTFLARIKVEYRETPYIYIIEPKLSEYHLTIFVCFAAIFICMAAAYFIIRRPFAAIVCFVTAIPVFSVLMFGFEPNYIAFFGVITCWAAVLAYESSAAERISDKQCKKCSSYCAFSAAVFSALSIIIIIFSMKLFGYQRPERLNAIYDNAVEYINGGNVQQVIDDIITIATRNNSPSGAINHGKLGEFDDIHFDGNTVLQVTIPKSEDTIYLRGFVGSVYTGNSWEQLPSSKLSELEKITDNFSTDGLSPLLFDGYNMKYTRSAMPQYSFSVKNISANNKYLYMPYNLVPESVSRYETLGGSSFGGSSQSYFGQFYDPKEYYGYRDLFRKRWSVPSALSADEAAYRQFVYENYLDLPDGFSRTDIFSESYYKYITAEEVKTGKSTLDEMTVFSRKLYYIKKWLRDNCEYSLSAGKLPAGEDFVEYFLDNRKGSCSHFASAAVIMCRYAGIPARYVEGYIIKPMDFPAGTTVGTSAKINVSDARGHAWVEIYIDGFGWYPMEFTSGYGNVRTAIPTETTVTETLTEISETSESLTDIETTVTSVSDGEMSPQPQETTHINSENAETSETAETTVLFESDTMHETETNATDSNTKKSVGFGIFGIKGDNKVDVLYDLTWVLVAVIIAAAVPLLFIARRNIIITKRRRTKGSSGAIEDYRRFMLLMKLMKMPEQGEMNYSKYAKELSARSKLIDSETAEIIINTSLKASFGGESLTTDEAHELRIAVNSLVKRYYIGLSHFGRFKLKYIYCII